jgi:hypothetical protein
MGGFMASEALGETAGESMRAIRNAIAIASDEAIQLGLIKRNEQLRLAEKANELGFNVGVDLQSLNPLWNQFYKMDVATDLTDAFTDLSKIDTEAIPTSVAREIGLEVNSVDARTLSAPGFLERIARRSALLAEHGRYVLKGSNRGPGRGAPGGPPAHFQQGGFVPYGAASGMFSSLGTDTIPAMLTPGEYVVRKSAVENFGVDNLEKINNGTYDSSSMYNYNLSINVKSESNPDQIARTVIDQIKRIDSQRIRGNRY